ncbi:right-handed parallel beta-helix repeat-containing protein [bacterium]|nr:right-handed parallel beta-helix repeat-containing protein [bacterium]
MATSHRLLPVFLLASFSPFLAIDVHAVALHVPGDYPTIQAAVDAAAAGDSVLVGPGVWDQREVRTAPGCNGDAARLSVAVFAPGISLIATDGPAVTILDGGPPGSVPVETVRLPAIDGAPCRLEGFTVTGGSTGIAAVCTDSRLDVADCRIIDNGSSALSVEWATVSVADSRIDRNVTDAVLRGAVQVDAGAVVDLLRTSFDANEQFALRSEDADRIHIDDCEFTNHGDRVVRVASCPDVVVRNTRIHDNAPMSSILATGALHFQWVTGSVESCTFARVLSRIPNGAALFAYSSFLDVVGNVFFECATETDGSLVHATGGSVRMRRNVVSRCEGAVIAVSLGCNVFWENGGNELPAAGDLSIDPQFCDADALDFHVRAGSPCLPGFNGGLCDSLIGAFGAGCPAGEEVVVALRSAPESAWVWGDGHREREPALFAWMPGTTHEISADEIQNLDSGRRLVFAEWDDGGDLTHEVAAPPSFAEWVVSFDTEYRLHTALSGDGTLLGGGDRWLPAGAVDSVIAIPASGSSFDRWEGSGNGSYSGPDSVAFVTMNGPVFEHAYFLPRQYPLTMIAHEGGTVTPPSGLFDRGSVIQIEALPDSDRAFVRWFGDGDGAYDGFDNPATITMNDEIVQDAYFADRYPILTMQADSGGTVTPPTGPQEYGSVVAIQAIPDPGYEFAVWTGAGPGHYTGIDNPRAILIQGPITQTAHFQNVPFPLEMFAAQGGAVTPESGGYLSFTDVEIEAIPDSGYVFRQWKGQGTGSYTGTERIAMIHMGSPIAQLAEFDAVDEQEWNGYDVTLSLSDTDPHVHTGDPVGFGAVHLWLDCGTNDGIVSLQADVGGTMEIVGFEPAPGILSAGTGGRVDLASTTCLTGPVRLGRFLVLPPGEGTLCIGFVPPVSPITVTDCAAPPVPYSWPKHVRFTGARTDGGTPCVMGSGCEAPLAVGATAAAVLPAPLAFDFAGAVPNPFAGATEIRFSLPHPAFVALSIYDVAGRRVRRLLDEARQPGRHVVAWSGRDDAGRMLPGGIYFARLDAGSFRDTRKLVWLGAR